MKRIAHLMLKNTALVGGIETFVTKAFLTDAVEGGYGYGAYCLRAEASEGADRARVAPHRCFRRLPDALGKLVLTPWALWRARRDGASVVHFHGFGASVWAPLAKALGMSVVSHSHGIEWQRARWRGASQFLLYVIAWVTCRFSDRVLVVSRKEADAYRKRFDVACVVVPGGFELQSGPIDCTTERQRVVTVAGRPVPEKRILEAVIAWNRIADHRGYTLQVYCGGRYGGGLLEQIRAACEVGNDVRLIPFVPRDEFVAHLRVSSYYVALSTLEGRSLAMLEALATGNVLVVADTPENREFVPDHGNHYVAMEAGPAAIATALEHILDLPPPTAEIRGRNVHAGTVRSWVDVRQECEAVYASL